MTDNPIEIARPRPGRPPGVTALCVFFAAGAAIAGASCLSLLDPGGFLEPMWRLNPRARAALEGLGAWGIVLMAAVAAACATGGVRLWRGPRGWGRLLAIGVIAATLIGDAVNVALGTEPRAVFGLPIAAALLAYLLTSRVRAFFRGG